MLNLLPQEVKDRYKYHSKLYSLGLAYILILVVLGLGAIGIATYNLTVAASLGQKQTEIDVLAAQKQKKTDVTDKAAFIEDRMEGAAAFQEKTQWEKILQQVADATPTNIQLTTTKVSTTGIDISGKTTDRRAIVLFSDRLSTQPNLSGAAIQSITDEVADGGPKSFTFTINAGVKQ